MINLSIKRENDLRGTNHIFCSIDWALDIVTSIQPPYYFSKIVLLAKAIHTGNSNWTRYIIINNYIRCLDMCNHINDFVFTFAHEAKVLYLFQLNKSHKIKKKLLLVHLQQLPYRNKLSFSGIPYFLEVGWKPFLISHLTASACLKLSKSA